MKIAFFDHSFHKKTLSSNFFMEMLTNRGISVDCLWDDSWKGGKALDFSNYFGKYDAYIFWQQTPKTDIPFYKYNANIIYIPMLDNYGSERELHHNREVWKKYAGTKVLCFSKALYNASLSHGLASKHFMYYPNPLEHKVSEYNNSFNAFFWQRIPEQINWTKIKALINNNTFNKIYIHNYNDPGSKSFNISKSDVLNYNIQMSTWFEEKSEYYKIIDDTTVYFAPRKCEGIGLSFLEAMAMGKCVVTPDYATMNEYIINGINGLLYDLNSPRELEFNKKQIVEICKRSRETIEIGYKNWKAKEDEIIDFIINNHNNVYKQFYGDIDYQNISSNIYGNATINCLEKDTENIKSLIKRKIVYSKLKPLIYPIFRIYKSFNKNNISQIYKNTSSISTLNNIVEDYPIIKENCICGSNFNISNSIKEGGIRLNNKFKKSYTTKPLVSIITVVFNCVEKIERAIISVLSQTYDNIEYIIIDGGSVDGTMDIIEKYKDSIDYYCSQKDNGIYDAMNKGISLATGDFIGIVNADDKFYDNAVELSMREIIRSKADYSAAEDYCVDSSGNFIGIFKVMHLDERALVAQHPCNHGTMFIHKKIYNKHGNYDTKYKIGADYKFQLKVVTDNSFKGCKVLVPIHYFEMAGVSSQYREKALGDVINILCEFLKNTQYKYIKSLVLFMHENNWNNEICNDLEKLLDSCVFNQLQKSFLIERMKDFGYKNEVDVLDNTIGVVKNRRNMVIFKLIKYITPYGIIQKRRG